MIKKQKYLNMSFPLIGFPSKDKQRREKGIWYFHFLKNKGLHYELVDANYDIESG